MSLLKFFQKIRSTSSSQTSVEADPESQPGELTAELDKLSETGCDDLIRRDLESDNESDDDDGCDKSVPGSPLAKKPLKQHVKTWLPSVMCQLPTGTNYRHRALV